jgi:AraC family ethanolamine operon transcriptional activator
MPDLARLSSSPVLSAVHCCDPEQVVNMLPGTRRRLLPLTGDFEFFQASLHLGYLGLAVVKRPPCASEGYLEQHKIGIALAMNDSPGLKLDGVPLDRPALVTHGLTTPHRIFQPGELTIAALFLPDRRGDRGWPARVRAAKVDPIQPAALQQLRSLVRDIVYLASRDPMRFSQDSVVAGMQQSLLGTIDHAFATAPGEKPTGLAIRKYVRICRLADEFVSGKSKHLPSSADVAAAAGVTIRTLHNAMVAVNGMSLQKFMILNRLWAVRAALARAGPEGLVKTIAFDHGFWHLGRFSQVYRAFFHESPSDTLAHAKQRARPAALTGPPIR